MTAIETVARLRKPLGAVDANKEGFLRAVRAEQKAASRRNVPPLAVGGLPSPQYGTGQPPQLERVRSLVKPQREAQAPAPTPARAEYVGVMSPSLLSPTSAATARTPRPVPVRPLVTARPVPRRNTGTWPSCRRRAPPPP